MPVLVLATVIVSMLLLPVVVSADEDASNSVSLGQVVSDISISQLSSYPEYIFGDFKDKFMYVRIRRLLWMRRVYRTIFQETSYSPNTLKRPESLPKSMTPDDPFYSLSWWLHTINAEAAWQVSTGKDVIVAVLDTGIDYAHPDIGSQLWYNKGEIAGDGIDNDVNGYIDDYLGWDFVGTSWINAAEDNNVIDLHGHGTHVGGIIAAEGNNSEGIIGVAPDASILPVKVLDDEGKGNWDTVAKGIMYAADMGAKIINLSFGGFGYAGEGSILSKAVKYAANKGCVLVAAAGNKRANADDFLPANMEAVISVTATTGMGMGDYRVYSSNFGDTVDVSAPGVNILSLRASGTAEGNLYSVEPIKDPEAEYIRMSGTSMAAAVVSGVAALLISDSPELTPEEVRQILRRTSIDAGTPGFDKYFGYGRIDAFEALTFNGDVDKDGANETGNKIIKGADVNEVLSKQEVLAKKIKDFNGHSPKMDMPEQFMEKK